MENQPNARSALRLEALLPDPIEEQRTHRKRTRELSRILNRQEQFRGFLAVFDQNFNLNLVNQIMTDDDWGTRRL